MRRRCLALLCITIAWVGASFTPLAAHDLERTRVTLAMTSGGRFELVVWNDPDWLVQRLERFADNAQALPRPATLAERDQRLAHLAPLFPDRIVLFVDGHEVRPDDVEFVASPRDAEAGARPLARYRLRGRLPRDARTLRWYYGLVVDPYPIEIQRADGRLVTEVVLGDAWSTSLDLSGQFQPVPGTMVARRAFASGATAIVPDGSESLFFVCGLMLASLRGRRRRGLIVFAASLLATLSAVLLRVVPMPPAALTGIVTAGSLIYVALECVSERPFVGWRAAVVAAIGGAHGLRVATHVIERGLAVDDPQRMLTWIAVVSGVVIVLVAAAVVTVGCIACYRDREWYRDRIAVPMAIATGGAGAAWTAARLAAALVRG